MTVGEEAAAQVFEATASEQAKPESTAGERRYLAAFVTTVIVLMVVLILLPMALSSMWGELRGQGTERVYDLFTGTEVAHDAPIPTNATFVNITVNKLDEANGVAALTLSGHRVCPALCPALTATFYSIGHDAARRHGLPPSATVTVPSNEGSYTYTIELPIHGSVQMYPFDDYVLSLGLVISADFPGGVRQIVDEREVLRQGAVMTIENRVARMNMSPPIPIDPATARAPSDPFTFLVVDELLWERPAYLRILTALLIVLITISGIFALGLRSLHELVLGIGGIILGIWGIRSIVVQSELPDITLVDLLLGLVILLLLVGLAVRAAHYFYVKSGVRLRR
jgi:hypothetical protein